MNPDHSAKQEAADEIIRLESEIANRKGIIARENARIEIIEVQIAALKPLASKVEAASK
jgi:hypothetical protein